MAGSKRPRAKAAPTIETAVWRPVVEFQGLYEVSDAGHVRNVGSGRGRKNGRVLAPGTMPRGYLVVNLWRHNKGTTRLVHRLVAEAFIGAIPDDREINHKNGIKSDNRAVNLEIVTQAANREHAIGTGLIDCKGERNPMAKIDQVVVLKIRQMHAAGVGGYDKLAAMLSLNRATVRNVVKRKTWAHVGESAHG